MNWEGLWNYIRERETIRISKDAGNPWPWTQDKILQTYKFTNVLRVNDRTTQAFLVRYIQNSEAYPHVALYNCALYRYFGTAAWMNMIGWLTFHDKQRILNMAKTAVNAGKQIFTGAYVITNSGQTGPKYEVVETYLSALWDKARQVTDAIALNYKWEDGYRVLHELPGFGGTGFMAKEVLQDYLLWLPWYPLDNETFTPIGPGAQRGLSRVMGRNRYEKVTEKAGQAEINAIRAMISPKWQFHFRYAMPLTAHDIQFCLCEFDKYERARLGQGTPRAQYRAAKQQSFL